MPDVVKHAWTHRPRAQGGTDPIEAGTSFMPSWATASRLANSVSFASNFYRPRLDYLVTNDTDCFELVGNSANLSDYVRINKDGLYHCWFSIQQQTAGTSWGGIYTAIQAVMNVGAADVDIETQIQTGDFHPSPLNPYSEALLEEDYGPPSHSALTLFIALDYRAADTLTTPLEVACRLIADSGSSFNLITYIHLVRLTDGAPVTEIDSADLS